MSSLSLIPPKLPLRQLGPAVLTLSNGSHLSASSSTSNTGPIVQLLPPSLRSAPCVAGPWPPPVQQHPHLRSCCKTSAAPPGPALAAAAPPACARLRLLLLPNPCLACTRARSPTLTSA